MRKRDADGPGPDAEHIDALLRDVADSPESAAPAGEPSAPTGGSAGVPTEPTEGAVRRLEDQLAELRDRHARLAAEFDNYRKRMARERLEGNDRAQAQLMLKLLDSLDDLDRVVATRHEGLTVDGLREAGQMPFDPPDVGGWPQNGYWLGTAASLARLKQSEMLAQTIDVSDIGAVPRHDRPGFVGRMLSVGPWSTRTAGALARVAHEPRMLLTAALLSPEYLLN